MCIGQLDPMKIVDDDGAPVEVAAWRPLMLARLAIAAGQPVNRTP